MNCELNLIEDDKYLVPLLRACNKEELDFLVDLMKDKISDKLSTCEKFKKYYPDHTKYCDEISAEIQYYGGNTLFDLIKNKGVRYEKIIQNVAKKLKLKDFDDLPVDTVELKIIEKVLETTYDNADENIRMEMFDYISNYQGNISDYAKYSKQAFMSLVQMSIKTGDFKSYQLSMIIANGISKQLFRRGLALATNASLARAVSIFAGPVGWAIPIIWSIFDVAGPAYRVIVPAVIYISYLRLKFKNQRRGFILIGKSGHGKSSLINCLAGVNLAEVSHIKPTTPETKVYNIDNFNGKYPLRIIDTRGIFESTKPNHKIDDDALQALNRSMIRENPAVIMHIMSAKEVRAMSEDQKIFKEILNDIKLTMNNNPHRIFVITKCGDLGNPRTFPTDEHFVEIIKLLDYFCDEILGFKKSPINKDKPEIGCVIEDENSLYEAVIPVKCLNLENNWNIETLSDYLEKIISEMKLYDFEFRKSIKH